MAERLSYLGPPLADELHGTMDIDATSDTGLLSGHHIVGDAARGIGRLAFHVKAQHRVAARSCIAVAGCAALACVIVLSRPSAMGPTLPRSNLGNSIGFAAQPSSSEGAGHCDVDEEYFGSLCYKKCSLLTNGGYPIRTSAMTCCRSTPCGLFNQRHNMGFCSGFSVAGGSSKSCPHPPGRCLPDEELLVGQCYKRCSLLTNNEYPYRVAPSTCCNKPNSEIICLLPRTGYSLTDTKFAVGGGSGMAAGFHSPIAHTDLANLTTPITTTEGGATAAGKLPGEVPVAPEAPVVTQPPLPDWYTDMQKAKESESASASQDDVEPEVGHDNQVTEVPVEIETLPEGARNAQPTPRPVPDWAQKVAGAAAVAAPEPSPAPAPPPAPSTTPAPAIAAEDASAVPQWAAEMMSDSGFRDAGVIETTAPPATLLPTTPPTALPTALPTMLPTTLPTQAPTPAPTPAPTTPAPTTPVPTTLAPTTPAPTTPAPTTPAPTTPAPSPAPTTAVPTTLAPTPEPSLERTTAAPTSAVTRAPESAATVEGVSTAEKGAAADEAGAAEVATTASTSLPDWLKGLVATPTPEPEASAAPERVAPARAAQDVGAERLPSWAREMMGELPTARPQAVPDEKGAPNWVDDYFKGKQGSA